MTTYLTETETKPKPPTLTKFYDDIIAAAKYKDDFTKKYTQLRVEFTYNIDALLNTNNIDIEEKVVEGEEKMEEDEGEEEVVEDESEEEDDEEKMEEDEGEVVEEKVVDGKEKMVYDIRELPFPIKLLYYLFNKSSLVVGR